MAENRRNRFGWKPFNSARVPLPGHDPPDPTNLTDDEIRAAVQVNLREPGVICPSHYRVRHRNLERGIKPLPHKDYYSCPYCDREAEVAHLDSAQPPRGIASSDQLHVADETANLAADWIPSLLEHLGGIHMPKAISAPYHRISLTVAACPTGGIIDSQNLWRTAISEQLMAELNIAESDLAPLPKSSFGCRLEILGELAGPVLLKFNQRTRPLWVTPVVIRGLTTPVNLSAQFLSSLKITHHHHTQSISVDNETIPLFSPPARALASLAADVIVPPLSICHVTLQLDASSWQSTTGLLTGSTDFMRDTDLHPWIDAVVTIKQSAKHQVKSTTTAAIMNTTKKSIGVRRGTKYGVLQPLQQVGARLCTMGDEKCYSRKELAAHGLLNIGASSEVAAGAEQAAAGDQPKIALPSLTGTRPKMHLAVPSEPTIDLQNESAQSVAERVGLMAVADFICPASSCSRETAKKQRKPKKPRWRALDVDLVPPVHGSAETWCESLRREIEIEEEMRKLKIVNDAKLAKKLADEMRVPMPESELGLYHLHEWSDDKKRTWLCAHFNLLDSAHLANDKILLRRVEQLILQYWKVFSTNPEYQSGATASQEIARPAKMHPLWGNIQIGESKSVNTEMRWCVDCRDVQILKEPTEIPLDTDTSLSNLANSSIISTVDNCAAYHVCEVESTTVERAIVTTRGTYRFKRLSMGNTPHTYQRLVRRTLADLPYRAVLPYLDNICIPSNNVDDHILSLTDMFKAHEIAGAKLLPWNCHLFQPKLKHLGCRLAIIDSE